jgi:MFS family permease
MLQAATARTRWFEVAALIGAGFIVACQVGKAAIAVPLLRQDLGIGLVAASWIVGAYGALGALAGLPTGLLVARFGVRRAVIAGLMLVGVGSSLGALAATPESLMATRVLEGAGFLLVVIAAPALLRLATAPQDRDVVFACWSTYMPGGTALMLLLGPALTAGGWPPLWLANGLAAGLYGLILWGVLRQGTPDAPAPEAGPRITAMLRPGQFLLALAFGAYTFQYFALSTLLPTVLVERLGLGIGTAGAIGAAAVIANALGNLAAGVLMRLRVPLWATMASAFAVVGLAAPGIFAADLPLLPVAALACASLGISGLIPASIFAAAPRLATTSPLMAVTLGLLIQASNLGQLLGPAALGSEVEHFGWPSAWTVFVAVAVVGIAVALRLRKLL